MTNFSKWFAVLSIAAVAGCGGNFLDDCKSVCERSLSCSGQTQDSVTACKSECASEGDLNDNANCGSQADDYAKCAREGNVCSTSDKCETQLSTYQKCLTSYCSSHQSDSGCADLTG